MSTSNKKESNKKEASVKAAPASQKEEQKSTVKSLPVTQTNQQAQVKKYMTETETETESNISDTAVEGVKPLAPPAPPTAEEMQAKVRSFKTRSISSIMMFSGFLLIITMGHVYCAILVLSLAFFMYKEIISLKRREDKDKRNQFSWIDWYYFAAFAFLMIPNLFVRRVLVEGAIQQGTYVHLILYDYHKLISFGLFIFGILLFVWSLERGSYRYQFQRFAWSMLALILVFCVPTFISYNVYKGIFWFVFPQLCVICNDVMAYIFGIMFGKTPLIKLSPKKTWEGFIGGMLSTYVLAFVITDLLSESKFLVCPQTHVNFALFESLDCQVPEIFNRRDYALPFGPFMGYTTFSASPAQLHSIVIASFASLIAPFGGFFASGVKRAFRIKDFGDTIPGHGGITDRFDCHGLMGIFIYIYLTQVVFRSADSFERVLDLVNTMTLDDKSRLLQLLVQDLAGNATLPTI